MWPGKKTQPRGKAPLVEKALQVLGQGGMVRFTEADLDHVPSKTLALLGQSITRFAKKEGFDVALRFATEANGVRALYILRTYRPVK